jgi:hypothetical protein
MQSPEAKGATVGGKPKTKKEKPLTPEDLYKLSVAEELGLGEKVRAVGWGGLTAAETGRIGGYINRKAREKADAAKAE